MGWFLTSVFLYKTIGLHELLFMLLCFEFSNAVYFLSSFRYLLEYFFVFFLFLLFLFLLLLFDDLF
jgi:hypothetical protein